MGGCNACLLIGGESGSGKSFSMAGDGRSKAGLGPMIMDHVFLRLAKGMMVSNIKKVKVILFYYFLMRKGFPITSNSV